MKYTLVSLLLSLAAVFTYFIGPGVLACATRGGGRSEAGHCFHLLYFFFLFLLRLLLFTHFGESPVRFFFFFKFTNEHFFTVGHHE